MPVEFITCEQGSEEWHAARCGIPTASRFSDNLAQGKGLTRAKYMRELAGEIITGTPADKFTNAAMERGKEMEAQARAEYEFLTDMEVELVGFAVNGRRGASPDGLLPSRSGLVEIKTKLPHLMIECIERGTIPPDHVAQVQGNLWITERDNADFVAFWPGMPLFVCTVFRDDDYIKKLSDEVDRFTDELDAMVERVRNYRIAA